MKKLIKVNHNGQLKYGFLEIPEIIEAEEVPAIKLIYKDEHITQWDHGTHVAQYNNANPNQMIAILHRVESDLGEKKIPDELRTQTCSGKQLVQTLPDTVPA